MGIMADNVLQWLAWLHLIICVVYLVFFFGRGDMYKCFFPMVLFFPHVWTMLFLIGRTIMYEIQRKREYNKDELMLPGIDGNSLIELDKEKETNIVPVEEALLMNEYDVKRKMVIEIAKRDPAGYLEKLKMALLSEDSETAHYAASSISHLKRTNDKELRIAKEKYEKAGDLYIYRCNYIDILDRVIKNKLSVDAIISGYVDELIVLLEEHIGVDEDIVPEDYDMLIDYLIRQKNMAKADEWIQEYKDKYPDNEKPLVYELKVCYLNNDKNKFDKIIEEIQNRGSMISQDTIDMIEFWEDEQ